MAFLDCQLSMYDASASREHGEHDDHDEDSLLELGRKKVLNEIPWDEFREQDQRSTTYEAVISDEQELTVGGGSQAHEDEDEVEQFEVLEVSPEGSNEDLSESHDKAVSAVSVHSPVAATNPPPPPPPPPSNSSSWLEFLFP